MKVFLRGYKLDNCGECRIGPGLMQFCIIKLKNKETSYLLCKKCIKQELDDDIDPLMAKIFFRHKNNG